MGSILLLSSMLKDQAVIFCKEWGFSHEGTKDELIGLLRQGLIAVGIEPTLYDFQSRSQLVPQSAIIQPSNNFSRSLDIPAPQQFELSPSANVASRWEKWLRCFEVYLSCIGDEINPNRKASLLLHVSGSQILHLVDTFDLERDGDYYKQLVKTITDYFRPRKNKHYERFLFGQSIQKEHESTDVYVTRLRELGSHCEFTCSKDDCKQNLLEEMITDQVVQNGYSTDLRKKYLREENLILNKILEISRSYEAANHQTESMTKFQLPDSSSSLVQAISGNKEFKSSKENKNEKLCYFCESYHVFGKSNCPAGNAVCHTCEKVGHYARSRKCQKKQKTVNTNRQDVRTVEVHNDNENDSDCHIIISKLSNKDGNSGAIFSTLIVAGKEIKFLLGGGATCNVLCSCDVPVGLSLEPARKLRLYDGSELHVNGKIMLPVTNPKNGRNYDVVFHVIEDKHSPVLGINTLQVMELMSIRTENINSVSTGKDFKLDQILVKYEDIFGNDLGRIKGVSVQINLKDDPTPSFARARTVPFALRSAVETSLNKAVADGSIEKVDSSDWSSPTVNVAKKDGTIRICSDFKRSVNPQIKVDTYPFPSIDYLFSKLNGAKVFTKLDLSRCYEQLEVIESCRDILTINTHKGLYRHKRLPYGIACAPAICQRAIEKLLANICGRVLIYMDDVLLAGVNEQELLLLMQNVFDIFQDHNVRLNRSKCEFMCTKVDYLGYVVSGDGIHTDPAKVESISQAKVPQTTGELRSFLGIVNYYGRFCPDLSTIAAPLNALTCNDAVWQWTDVCQASFDKIKYLLTNAPILAHYSNDKTLILQCDASPVGVGCVLAHRIDDGSESPVAYAHRSLSKSERNYAQIDREALSIIFGVEKFTNYLFGREFIILTDHQPLVRLLGPKTDLPALATARLQRWAIKLSPFRYIIEYKAGRDNGNADALSRLPAVNSINNYVVDNDESAEFYVQQIENLPVNGSDVATRTNQDLILKSVFNFVKNGWPSKCSDKLLLPYYKKRFEIALHNDILLWGRRVIIPSNLREQVMTELHDNHPGSVRMRLLAKIHCWWPSIDSDLEDLVSNCNICQEARHHPIHQPVLPWSWPEAHWDRIHVDYSPKFEGKALLILIDAHSKWPEVAITNMNDTGSTTTINILKRWFTRYGYPKVIVSDNGPQFVSEEFEQFLKTIGVRRKPIAPYHPSSNGEAERAVQTVKNSVRKILKGQKHRDLQGAVNDFLLSYRSTPHATTKVTPAELLGSFRSR